MTPKETLGRKGRPDLKPGSRLYLTHLPSTASDDLVAAASLVAGWGLSPVPHIAARAITSHGELDRLLHRLTTESQVDDVLVIAGSQSNPDGPFESTMSLLDTGLVQEHGIGRVAVAGHPEGTPDIDESELAGALDDKNRFARESGLDVRIVTQFCFDAATIVEWERRIRAAGNRLPVHVGLAGLASPAKVLKFGISCGVGPSLKVLRKQAGGVLRLAMTPRYLPDGVIAGLARAVAGDPASLISNVHFFPFGTIDDTAGWVDGVRQGQYEVGST